MKTEQELIAIAAITQHVAGDCLSLYEAYGDFQGIFGAQWWQDVERPNEKILHWLLKHDAEINRIDNDLVRIVVKEVNLG